MNPRENWTAEELARADALGAQLRADGATSMIAVRAPGRVNLIGEHTDYSGLPVMPIAIDRSTIIVAAPREDSMIEVRNVDAGFEPRQFRIDAKIPPHPAGDWVNYVKAGFQGVIDRFGAVEKMRGATMIVDGRVPPAAGLSSSAALTVASALTLKALNGFEQEALETAQMVARSEWYVGTLAGGMDQAASMLGRRDHALLIHFDPLRVTPVRMPSDAVIIVADSLEVADKSGKVRDEYNRRVIECAIAARILGKQLKLKDVRVLGDVVQKAVGRDARDLLAVLSAETPASVSISEAAKILGTDQRTLREEIVGSIQLEEKRPLEVMRRAHHVLSENERVVRAAEAFASASLEEMGALMNASHQSLRDDFEVSTPRLDAMVECARRAGAFGARLTGAGFGGCIIALTSEERAPDVLKRLQSDYYSKLGSDAASRALHTIVHASPGADVIELT